METTTRGRSSAAVDYVGDGRRFPFPPPPHGRDTDSASANMAALVFRREQLLQELHRERIRHDMIMCELAETERVMTACLAGRGALCGRPLMTPWEEAMYRTSRSSGETSWWSTSPSGPAVAPVYPRVERSPSPVRQLRSVDNAEKQERGSSSRPLAVAPSALPDAEQCPSLSKQPAVEEAFVPAAANVNAKSAQLPLLSKEVTLESQSVVDHEHEAGLKDRHVMQPMQSGIQISEQLKCAAVGQEHKAEAKDTHAVQLMDCEIQRSEQPMHAAVGQECRAEAKDRHAMQLMECEIKTSEQLKHEAFGQVHEAEKDRHTIELSKISEQKKPEEPSIKDHTNDERRQLPDQYALSGNEKSTPNEQKRPVFNEQYFSLINVEPTIKDHTNDQRRQLPDQSALVGKEQSRPNEQKILVFNEPSIQITPSLVKGNQILGPTVETPPPKRHKPLEEWSCTYCKVNLSCEEDLTRHQASDLHKLILALHSRQEAAGLATKSAPESSYRAHQVTRRLVRPSLPNNLEESEPQKAKWASGNHLKHKSHQENKCAAGEGGKEGSKCATERTGTEDQRKEFLTKRRLLFCWLCKVQCNSDKMMQSHLGGKRHRENLQARH